MITRQTTNNDLLTVTLWGLRKPQQRPQRGCHQREHRIVNKLIELPLDIRCESNQKAF